MERSDDGEDLWVDDANSPRNYDFFGLVAGVRGGEPLYEPRGLPSDLSEIVGLAWKIGEGDWHTPSYLDIKEFERCVRHQGVSKSDIDDATPDAFLHWDQDTREYPNYPSVVAHCKKKVNELKAEHVLLGDPNKVFCRLVFWFDN